MVTTLPAETQRTLWAATSAAVGGDEVFCSALLESIPPELLGVSLRGLMDGYVRLWRYLGGTWGMSAAELEQLMAAVGMGEDPR